MAVQPGVARSRVGGGAARQKPDPRDQNFTPSKALLDRASQEPSWDLSKSGPMPPVWDQGQFESCVAHAVGASWSVAQARMLKLPPRTPSRLFIWYEGRRIENKAVTEDPIDLRTGFFASTHIGVPDEPLWPYDAKNVEQQPPQKVYDAAEKLPSFEYVGPTQTLDALKAALVDGYPVAFVFSIFDSFEPQVDAGTCDFGMPDKGEESSETHAAVIVGFDDQAKRFKVRNSQGEKWGKGGYFTLLYDFVLSEEYAWDFWTLRPKVGNDG